MITGLEKILNQEELNQLLEALTSNKEYHFSNGEVEVKATSTDNSLAIQVEFKKKDAVKEELDKFEDYLKSLDDGLFIEVCEYLGDSTVSKIQECLSSEDMESVRAGILRFKNALSNLAKSKINYYKQYE